MVGVYYGQHIIVLEFHENPLSVPFKPISIVFELNK